jgi:hypothetical protein
MLHHSAGIGRRQSLSLVDQGVGQVALQEIQIVAELDGGLVPGDGIVEQGNGLIGLEGIASLIARERRQAGEGKDKIGAGSQGGIKINGGLIAKSGSFVSGGIEGQQATSLSPAVQCTQIRRDSTQGRLALLQGTGIQALGFVSIAFEGPIEEDPGEIRKSFGGIRLDGNRVLKVRLSGVQEGLGVSRGLAASAFVLDVTKSNLSKMVVGAMVYPFFE